MKIQPIRTDEILRNFMNEAVFKPEDTILITQKELKDYIAEIVEEYNKINRSLRKRLGLRV